MGKKCTFVKLSSENSRRANIKKPRETKESRAKVEAIKLDKIKRAKEWRKWWT
tara:strand:+ start:10574 stop:10732 length:159 start_codon:yes stop_codon:yes gene_type:complete